MLDYGPIQSVFNYMWGKGSKLLEIHLQPLKHSMLIGVPNDYIRSKILEKRLWYVDTSMFYVSQWDSNPTVSYPEITSIPLWAHLRGVPFDLRTKEGLSHVAGLVGEPIETDDYTKNVSSLNVAHVKVEANLCKPLPTAGELIRENGEIIDVDIDYPWTPPLCSHFFCALLETHIKEQNLSSLIQKLCSGWSYTSNHGSDDDGRIIIIWNHPVSIQVLEQSRQTLTCAITLPTSIGFTFTAVYAVNTEAERTKLWMDLLNIQQTFSLLPLGSW
ncbi:hypothetical protein Bca52824_023947 [Brassica carinata]|uniref:DUF4283 domain-containing protein n=1 Tax=Brassica carinata TaxID=52824 RepID=A0A8X7VK71_BRACI|nr:hypothetical protein Bca52824_023947 [Brassica carinata]